ncbi:MAG: hypothetical protein ACKO11_02340 [Cuspidothrix sp.]
MKVKILDAINKEFQFSLEGKSAQIIIKSKRKDCQIILDAFENQILFRLTEIYPLSNNCIPIIIDQSIKSYGDALIALYLACFKTELISEFGNLVYHVVFAHALPISIVPSILLKIANLLSEVVDNKQLLLLDPGKLILVETVGSSISLSDITKKHSRLLEKNADLKVIYHTNIKSILLNWSDFCVTRFGEKPSETMLQLFSKIYIDNNFLVKEFWLHQECVAQSLIYKDTQYGIFYDLLAPWKLEYRSRRLGIFSGIHNLIEAYNLKLKYCMCYGDFPYKHEILSGLPHSKIPEINQRDIM